MPENPVEPTVETPEAPAEAATEEIDWKAEARKWETRAKTNKQALDEATPIVQQWKALEEASKTELQRQQEETARWQADAERWRTTSVSSRIEALAASSFADPSDAAAALAADPSKYLGVDGVLNDDAIRADLEAVLERKPHWRKPDQTPAAPRVPAPNPAQGSGGGRAASDPASEFASILQSQIKGL